MGLEMNKALNNTENAELTVFQNRISCLEDINHIVVHNLRGVASNIKMIVEMLLKMYVAKGEETAKKPYTFSLEQGLSLIGESSTSLIDTLSDIMKGLDFTGGHENGLEYEMCDISTIVSKISQQQNGFIIEKKASIGLLLGVTHVQYPVNYLESMLYNFISNALKYSRPDIPVEITVSTYRQDDRVILSVKDNGLGIDLDKYGNKVFQLNQVFHEGYDSKGIGLYITRKQVESLGGSISVRSKVNEGTEFIVTL
jgi:signal transduction histidine kinase